MAVSEAQLLANKANALKSTGPRTPEGKQQSRRNSYKHGLTGEGIVLEEGDTEEIARRVEALETDLKPRTPTGVMLICQMAALSVRTERAVKQESAAISTRVRNAMDDFDEERIQRANQLFDNIHEDLRNNLRKLKKMPEGVERLIDAWSELRDDLTSTPKTIWTAEHMVQAGYMMGIFERHARNSRVGALSRGVWGDFFLLDKSEGGELGEKARQEWSKARLVELIDAQIAELEAHYLTLDFKTIELDRLDAPDRALFDPSKEAALLRRYEAAARRDFFKALKEFRQVEVESEEARTPSKMGSSCQQGPPPAGAPTHPYVAPVYPPFPVTIMPDGKPLTMIRPEKAPG